MGTDKALLEYRQRPFLEVILENLRQAGVARRLVVLGHHADQIRAAVRLGDAEIVYNPQYRMGQTSSLQAGLRALNAPAIAGVLLCLVDHPAADARLMSALIDAFRESGAPAVIPVVAGRRGHPVLIGRPLFRELLALDPQQGANTVMHKYRHVTRFLEVNDCGVLLDIDDPDDYRTLRETAAE